MSRKKKDRLLDWPKWKLDIARTLYHDIDMLLKEEEREEQAEKNRRNRRKENSSNVIPFPKR